VRSSRPKGHSASAAGAAGTWRRSSASSQSFRCGRSWTANSSPSAQTAKPDFDRVCECMLARHREIPVTFLAFDVLSVDGHDLTLEPCCDVVALERSSEAK
jgi:hypothetical protein